MGLVIDKIKGPLLHKHKGLNVEIQKVGSSPGLPIVNFGFLYNWFSANDVRGICSDGWRVPIHFDFWTLVSYLDPSADWYTNIAAKHLKMADATWTDPSERLNDVGFNAKGTGLWTPMSLFYYFLTKTYFWSRWPELEPEEDKVVATMSANSTSFNVPSFYNRTQVSRNSGISVRLVKDSTTLTNGQSGTYIGNDGKVYPTICIGTQEWLACNLIETQYKNGDVIPDVKDEAIWSSLITGARCSFNYDQSISLIPANVIINEGESIIFKEGSNIELSLEDNTLTIAAAASTASTVTDITGNAGTATKLQTARNINGIPFDGSSNITVPVSQKSKNLMITLSTAL